MSSSFARALPVLLALLPAVSGCSDALGSVSNVIDFAAGEVEGGPVASGVYAAVGELATHEPVVEEPVVEEPVVEEPVVEEPVVEEPAVEEPVVEEPVVEEPVVEEPVVEEPVVEEPVVEEPVVEEPVVEEPVVEEPVVEEPVAGPYAGRTLYVEPDSDAAETADDWQFTDPDASEILDVVADQPISLWLGDWLSDVTATVDDAMTVADGELQVFTVYNIPDRDCGAWSDGGASDAASYQAFIDEVADGLAGRLAIIVLEPDALALVTCLDEAGQAERHQMLSDAVDTLTAAGGRVYLDAGDSNWIPAQDMADALAAAGIERAAGIALNVSHTEFTDDEADFAEEMSGHLGIDLHYVIDTSRNGLGPSPDNEWCNPLGRAFGAQPSLEVDPQRPGLDALLWIKRPGESDGLCNGGPDAGTWWPEYAVDLGEVAGY